MIIKYGRSGRMANAIRFFYVLTGAQNPEYEVRIARSNSKKLTNQKENKNYEKISKK